MKILPNFLINYHRTRDTLGTSELMHPVGTYQSVHHLICLFYSITGSEGVRKCNYTTSNSPPSEYIARGTRNGVRREVSAFGHQGEGSAWHAGPRDCGMVSVATHKSLRVTWSVLSNTN